VSRLRALAAGALVLGLSAQAAQAQDRSHYRDFQLGASLASVAALAGAPAADAKTVHQRPALMQDLAWRPSYFVAGSTAVQADPVQQIAFSFIDDHLFRLVVDYDRQRTEGMTDADMIEAISTVYGPTSKPATRKTGIAASPIEQESGQLVAWWGDAEYSALLYRSSYAPGFRLVVTSRRLDALARTADAQAARLDQREAPQREIARQKREADDSRTLAQKSRVANKAAFIP